MKHLFSPFEVEFLLIRRDSVSLNDNIVDRFHDPAILRAHQNLTMGTMAFEIRNTPDKGRGLFALRSIPKGSTILIENVFALSINGGMEGNVWMSPEFWAGLK
jgi:hypothetical protein